MNWSKLCAILCGRSQKWERWRLDNLASKIAWIEKLNQDDIQFQNWDDVKKRSHDYTQLNLERKKLLAKYERAWGKYE